MAIESETTNEGVCAKCNKSLSDLKFRKNRRFCSTLCRTRYFALKRYNDIKSTDDYKAKRRVYEKSWREANKDKWNARMRKAAAKYRAKKKLEKDNSNKVLDEGLNGQQPEETFTPAAEGDATGNVESIDQPSQLDTSLDEGLPGQQTSETTYSPELLEDEAEEPDQSSQLIYDEASTVPEPEEFCVCGHSSNHHSYDPENLTENNLACDICGCTNFRKQSFLPNPEPTTPTYMGPQPGEPRPTYQNNTAFVNEGFNA